MSETMTLTADTEHAGTRLDRWLADTLARDDLSRSRLKALIQEGALRRNGQVLIDPSAKVTAGADYSLTLQDATPALPQPEMLPLDILYEDKDLIAVNKAAGMVVHPAPGAEAGTLVNALLHHCGASLTGIGGVARPGIVHRLDKDTSGVMIAAKTARAHARLTEMFAAHDLDRRYQALIWGLPANRADTIDAALARHPVDRKRQAVQARGRHAVTHYRTLRDLPPFGCLIECQLETGRTHQIRVHMAHIGHGVMGDPLYGKPKRAGQMPDTLSRDALLALRSFPRQALHAASLSFAHPVSGLQIDLTSPLPSDMTALLTRIEEAIAARARDVSFKAKNPSV
ncbi:MAG: RluA family pseudouridine synthase [Candidatus Puniceispirillaceae bacterium]